jgi:hypothetical protein
MPSCSYKTLENALQRFNCVVGEPKLRNRRRQQSLLNMFAPTSLAAIIGAIQKNMSRRDCCLRRFLNFGSPTTQLNLCKAFSKVLSKQDGILSSQKPCPLCFHSSNLPAYSKPSSESQLDLLLFPFRSMLYETKLFPNLTVLL